MLQSLRAILWKNWLVRKRHPITFGFEVAIPLLLATLVCYVISRSRGGDHSNPLASDDDIRPGGRVPAKNYTDALFRSSYSFAHLSPLTNGPVLVAPNDDATQRLTQEVNRIHKGLAGEWIDFLFFDSDSGVQTEYAKQTQNKSYISGALVFTKLQSNFRDNSPLHYVIRTGKTVYGGSGITTDKKFFSASDDDQHHDYPMTSFLHLQFLVNEAYLSLKAQDMGKERLPRTSDLEIRTIPHPSHLKRPDSTLLIFIPIVIVNGLIVFFPTLVKRMIDEKANGSREMLRMVGLNDWIFWLANFLTHFTFLFVLIIIQLVMYFIKWNGYIAFFANSSFPVVLIFFILYCINVVLMAFLITIPFKKPIIGVVASVIIWTTSSMPASIFDANQKPFASTQRLWSCLLPNSALSFGLGVMGEKESVSSGVQFDNFSEPTVTYGTLTLLVIMGMMLMSSLIMCVLIWYLDNVWPWQDGVPKPLWFPFTRSYWCSSWDEHTTDDQDVAENPKFFEPVGEGKPVAIQLTHVSKLYGFPNPKLAVSDLSLRIFRDQLTCLLGHNGAGKTTTMNMITGMFVPSSGSISINGYDMATQTRAARESISLCPQHNPLYEELTAADHLFFYGAIKGFPWSQLQQEVLKTVANVTLTGHAAKHPSQLSGGMKRKLCLGMALVGDSQIVILDEPTSGLDTEVRRSIWDLLREVRKTRTILMSTHDMEEADALGDRIVIMTAGKATCAGSTMFLKKVYGAGHNLRIAKLPNFSLKGTTNVVQSHFPDCKVKSDVGTEVIISLEGSEKETTNRSVLPQFFRDFEKRKSDLGIESFGLSVTTMEDVFLRVGELSEPEVEDRNKEDANSSNSNTVLLIDENGISADRLTGIQLVQQQMVGLFCKRVNFGKRDWKILIFMIVIPAILLMICFAMTNHMMDTDQMDLPLIMNSKSVYGETTGFFGPVGVSELFAEKFKETASRLDVKLEVDDSGINPNDWYIRESEEVSLEMFLNHYIVGLNTSQPSKGERMYTTWASNAAYHAPPLTMDLLYKALDYELTGQKSQIQLTNHPLPKDTDRSSKLIVMIYIQLTLIVMIPITMAFLSSSYVLFPIHEKSSNAKLVQLMTGMNPLLLHFCNFLFDFMVHIVASLIAISVFMFMDVHHILSKNGAIVGAILLIFVFFGAASVMMAYVVAFFFKKSGTGYSVLVSVNLICGIVFCLVVFFWQMGIQEDPHPAVLFFFSLMPIYDVTSGVTKLYKASAQADFCRTLDQTTIPFLCAGEVPDLLAPCCPQDVCSNVRGRDFCLNLDNPLRWSMNGVGYELLMMFVAFGVYSVIVGLLDSGLMRKLMQLVTGWLQSRPSALLQVDDYDVEAEKKRISEMMAKNEVISDALVVNGVSKRFGKTLAVKEVTFGVHKQECFGLLGVNGAGKTTTFREFGCVFFLVEILLMIVLHDRHDHW